ncbi:AI-2E family transporter [Flocculibacter collagenilyticus]|uniref:AI-2E family transporter n=1 Tax=Flocculibacter collagenilyticus TaxID=2744479 RepID=UPI0018F4B8E4|nr:AI-2E family transporter [Flocculibacter collagenilyticus]
MIHLLKNWYKEKFSDPHAVTLFFVILIVGLSFYFVGELIVPVLVAISIAFLLEWPVSKVAKLGVSRSIATCSVLAIFIGVLSTVTVAFLPLVWNQGTNFLKEAPKMLEQGKDFLKSLPEQFPNLITTEQVYSLLDTLDNRILTFGETILQASFASLIDIVALAIYLVLVPLLVFFMLKDKEDLVHGFTGLLPRDRILITQVWHEMNEQIINYIRGKVIEILIIGVTTYVVFILFDLRYAALLGVLVGLSVLIPYIGAALVTIPVAMVALFQFGLSAEFGYIMLAYGIIQALDGNLLVPILFSEAVNLHPVYIIVAVLFFGGLWGFWGVFFAIPLASLVKAILNAWSNRSRINELEDAAVVNK